MEEQTNIITQQEPEAELVVVESEIVVQPAPILCSNCGTEIPEGMNFCPKCGKQVNAPEKTPALKKGRLKKPLLFGGIAVAAVVLITVIVLLLIPKNIPAADIVVSETAVELKEEETASLSCTVYPQDATDKTVIWFSSDEAVATVNELGAITAVKKGECTVTAQCGEITKSVTITVKSKIDFKELYEGIDPDAKYGWDLGSDGSYLSADSNVYDLDDYSNSTIWQSIKDMNKSLGLPDSLTKDMKETTWSMGRQTKTFAAQGLEVVWTYHPDKGMEVTYQLLDA